jgi:chromatin segregation and condensation protein Rec8/ScpA/Scc1 (kleisin family)
VDLLEVALSPVCEAYLAYLVSLPETNLDEAAAALAALAYLLERKAWMLIPVPEPEPDPYEEPELPHPGLDSDYNLAIEALHAWHAERADWFFRDGEAAVLAYELPYQLDHVSAQDLAREFSRVLQRAKPQETPILARPRRSIADELRRVSDRLSAEPTPLWQVLSYAETKSDCVFAFLAVLELVRLGQAKVQVSDEAVMVSAVLAPRAAVLAGGRA